MKHARQLYKLWVVLNLFRNVILMYFREHDGGSMASTSADIVLTKKKITTRPSHAKCRDDWQ